jgi:hypothetical protein
MSLIFMRMRYLLNYSRYFICMLFYFSSFFQEALTKCQQGVPLKQEIVYIADINVASPRAVI